MDSLETKIAVLLSKLEAHIEEEDKFRPDLMHRVDKFNERLDALAREVMLLMPVRERVEDLERRMRVVEERGLKLATQASLIAALMGSAIALLFKLFGG